MKNPINFFELSDKGELNFATVMRFTVYIKMTLTKKKNGDFESEICRSNFCPGAN